MIRAGLLLVAASGVLGAVVPPPGDRRAPLTIQAPPTAPTIVGEWIGQWRSKSASAGNLYLSVERVEGDEVQGHLFVAVAVPDQGYYNREVPFSGAFDGTTLSIWVPPSLWFSLTVTDRRMRGSVQGQYTFGTVELEKR
jgi:hypothetical protein